MCRKLRLARDLKFPKARPQGGLCAFYGLKGFSESDARTFRLFAIRVNAWPTPPCASRTNGDAILAQTPPAARAQEPEL